MPKAILAPTTALWPVPAVLVSCGVERPNIITLAWAGTACSEPPMVGIAVRGSRYSHGLIAAAGQFAVNLPRADQVEAVDICGTLSGRNLDKFARCGLTPAPASRIQVPLVAECPVHLECVVRHTVPLGSHDLFLGEIVAVQAEEELLDASGRIDFLRPELLAYVAGIYRGLGAVLGRSGFTLRD